MTTHPMPRPMATRRPRIALLGEFSAGKSTLANLLLGQDLSPVRVTATQMPPVWYRHGADSLTRIDVSGTEEALDQNDLHGISHRDTQAVRVALEADVLEVCDLIDMPGTSDPNLQQAVWDRMIRWVDGAIWCTPATQAWRQSEAALWDQMPPHLHDNSLLLITRMDKLQTEVDRRRVVARVRRETEGLFCHALPISLTEALADPDNPDALDRSGADQFVGALVDLIEALGAPDEDDPSILFDALPDPRSPGPVARDADGPNCDRVVPRRVAPKPETARRSNLRMI